MADWSIHVVNERASDLDLVLNVPAAHGSRLEEKRLAAGAFVDVIVTIGGADEGYIELDMSHLTQRDVVWIHPVRARITMGLGAAPIG
jgi:hypothetical protein